MKKKYILVIFIIIIFSFILYSNLSNNSDENVSIKDTLIKNLNWDSPLLSEVPYVIGNEIELYYILDSQAGRDFSIDLTLLRQEFNISEIKIGEDLLKISDNITFSITKNTPLKITGIAKNNSNSGENNLRNLIKITTRKVKKVDLQKNTSKTDFISDEIKNNDEKSDATLSLNQEADIKKDIEVIPEAINTNIFSELVFNQTRFSSNINNLLEIHGKNFEKIKYLNIGSYSFTPNFKDNSAYFLIQQNTFTSGNYFVFIQPEQGSIVPLDTQMNFQYSGSQVNIANISPAKVNNNKDTYIVLQGNGFNDIISLQLSNNIILKKTSFEIINDKVMSVKIDKNIDPGDYSFNIMTTNDIIKIDNMSFTIIK